MNTSPLPDHLTPQPPSLTQRLVSYPAPRIQPPHSSPIGTVPTTHPAPRIPSPPLIPNWDSRAKRPPSHHPLPCVPSLPYAPPLPCVPALPTELPPWGDSPPWGGSLCCARNGGGECPASTAGRISCPRFVGLPAPSSDHPCCSQFVSMRPCPSPSKYPTQPFCYAINLPHHSHPSCDSPRYARIGGVKCPARPARTADCPARGIKNPCPLAHHPLCLPGTTLHSESD